MKFGDKGDTFFIILQGVLSVKIPNPKILEWRQQFKKFNQLKNWENTEFKKRIDEAKRERLESYQLEQQLMQLIQRDTEGGIKAHTVKQ